MSKKRSTETDPSEHFYGKLDEKISNTTFWTTLGILVTVVIAVLGVIFFLLSRADEKQSVDHDKIIKLETQMEERTKK